MELLKNKSDWNGLRQAFISLPRICWFPAADTMTLPSSLASVNLDEVRAPLPSLGSQCLPIVPLI